MQSLCCRVISLFLILGLALPAAFARNSTELSAVVLKTDGDGAPRVRRKKGTEAVIGASHQIFPGDTIYTDSSSTVELGLQDGTIVRIGLNSEYRLEKADPQKGFIAWAFHLAKGSVRALVEKSPDKKHVKFRINTPAGTMGVRGTEFVLQHKQESGVTTLYTLEGVVEFGGHSCQKGEGCVGVNQGQKASIRLGDQRPDGPASFVPDEILSKKSHGSEPAGLAAEAAAKERSGDLDSEMASLFEPVKKLSAYTDVKSLGDISQLLNEASEKISEAQDAYLGRNKALREAVHGSMADGTYNAKIQLAEKFEDISAGKAKDASVRDKESTAARLSSQKIALADAVLNSRTLSGNSASQRLVNESGSASRPSGSGKGAGTGTAGLDSMLEQASRLQNQTIEATREPASQGAATQDPAGGVQAAQEPASASSYSQTGSGLNFAQLSLSTQQLSTYQIQQSTNQLNTQNVQAIQAEPEVQPVIESYKTTFQYHQYCGSGATDHCAGQLMDGNYNYYYTQKTSASFTTTVTTTQTQSANVCYEDVKTCRSGYIPCDLSAGRFCQPTYKKNDCVTEKKQVPCK